MWWWKVICRILTGNTQRSKLAIFAFTLHTRQGRGTGNDGRTAGVQNSRENHSATNQPTTKTSSSYLPSCLPLLPNHSYPLPHHSDGNGSEQQSFSLIVQGRGRTQDQQNYRQDISQSEWQVNACENFVFVGSKIHTKWPRVRWKKVLIRGGETKMTRGNLSQFSYLRGILLQRHHAIELLGLTSANYS